MLLFYFEFQSEIMSSKKTLFWVTFFSIAMGFLESAVVIYLRRIYYPQGFDFPLKPIDNSIAIVELWREAATIIMLLAVGVLAGKNKAERFAWFIFSFAIWDIFYYLFLLAFLGWPQSLFTWDILFLLPVPWVGPVIAPVIIAFTMIAFAMTTVFGAAQSAGMRMKERLLLLLGSLVAIVSFTEDYVQQKGDILYRNIRNGGSLFTDLSDYVPKHFDWPVFFIGEGIILLAWVLYFIRIKKRPSI